MKMFKHSVKVPRLYKIAAKVAKDVKEGIGSIKQLVYENRSKHPNIKAIYALVATLFQRIDEIESLLKRSQLLVKEPRSDPWLTKILIVELLWGKKSLPGNSKPEKTVLAYEQIFKAHTSDLSLTPKDNEINIKEEFKPRYVRVNTLRMSLNEAIDGFRDEGWVFSKFLDKNDYKGFLEKVASLAEDEFMLDIHVPDILIFPPKTQFYNHPAYKNGSIVLQDKASCLPVHILAPPPGSIVLDMCAAPGMKTTQVAAARKNEGKVYAVERNPRRFETLNQIVDISGATCVTTLNKDVLICEAEEFGGVQYILVDPSCSGSGISGRLDFEQSETKQRIEKLAGFQIKILRSALTKYPDAKKVVYSTCSVFPEENEDVVRQVLETNTTFKLVPAKKFVNDTWTNFGSPDYGDIGRYCLYAKPDEDFTNGFFVAVFEKLDEGEQNQFFNSKIYNFKKHVQSQENRKRKQKRDENSNRFTKDKDDRNDYVYEENRDSLQVMFLESKEDESVNHDAEKSNKSKKKKVKTEIDNDVHVVTNNEGHTIKSRKKKKRKTEMNNIDIDSVNHEENIIETCPIKQEFSETNTHKRKKKKEKAGNNIALDKSKEEEFENITTNEEGVKVKKEKIKEEERRLSDSLNSEFEKSHKRKKKKIKSENDNIDKGDLQEQYLGNDFVNEELSEFSKVTKKKLKNDDDFTYENDKGESKVRAEKHKKKKLKNEHNIKEEVLANENVDQGVLESGKRKKKKLKKSEVVLAVGDEYVKEEYSKSIEGDAEENSLKNYSVKEESGRRKKKKLKSQDVSSVHTDAALVIK